MLAPTQEQKAIADAAREVLEKELPLSRIGQHRGSASAFATPTWKTCATLGWFALGVAETDGGVGYTLADEIFLHREIGRCLAPGPYLATSLAVRLALAAGEETLAASLMDGSVAAALAQPRGPVQLGAQLSGTFDVYDPDGVDLLVVADPTGAVLVGCDSGRLDVGPTMDPGTTMAAAHLQGTSPIAFITADIEPAFLRGCVLASAALVGVAEAVTDMAVLHARTRVQFGKPIGVNQAIKHRCADMSITAAAAGAQVLTAALRLDESDPSAARETSAGKVIAARAVDSAAENIQIHGGMGFTYEENAHLYLKRAHVLATLFGSSRAHLDRLIPEGTANATGSCEAFDVQVHTPQ